MAVVREVWVTLRLRTSLPLGALARASRWMHSDAEQTADPLTVITAEAEDVAPPRRMRDRPEADR